MIFAVCHVMRYTRYTQMLKQLLDSGAIGEVVSIQHLEPVGYWHQAHSFVRGNWRNEAESSPMLLAKSCHDLDWLRYMMGEPCTAVSSFGSLKHFRQDQKPAEAGRGHPLPGLRLRAALPLFGAQDLPGPRAARAKPAGRWMCSPRPHRGRA